MTILNMLDFGTVSPSTIYKKMNDYSLSISNTLRNYMMPRTFDRPFSYSSLFVDAKNSLVDDLNKIKPYISNVQKDEPSRTTADLERKLYFLEPIYR